MKTRQKADFVLYIVCLLALRWANITQKNIARPVLQCRTEDDVGS